MSGFIFILCGLPEDRQYERKKKTSESYILHISAKRKNRQTFKQTKKKRKQQCRQQRPFSFHWSQPRCLNTLSPSAGMLSKKPLHFQICKIHQNACNEYFVQLWVCFNMLFVQPSKKHALIWQHRGARAFWTCLDLPATKYTSCSDTLSPFLCNNPRLICIFEFTYFIIWGALVVPMELLSLFVTVVSAFLGEGNKGEDK